MQGNARSGVRGETTGGKQEIGSRRMVAEGPGLGLGTDRADLERWRSSTACLLPLTLNTVLNNTPVRRRLTEMAPIGSRGEGREERIVERGGRQEAGGGRREGSNRDNGAEFLALIAWRSSAGVSQPLAHGPSPPLPPGRAMIKYYELSIIRAL